MNFKVEVDAGQVYYNRTPRGDALCPVNLLLSMAGWVYRMPAPPGVAFMVVDNRTLTILGLYPDVAGAYTLLAQMVERLPMAQKVTGSIPVECSNTAPQTSIGPGC